MNKYLVKYLFRNEFHLAELTNQLINQVINELEEVGFKKVYLDSMMSTTSKEEKKVKLFGLVTTYEYTENGAIIDIASKLKGLNLISSDLIVESIGVTEIKNVSDYLSKNENKMKLKVTKDKEVRQELENKKVIAHKPTDTKH